MILGYYWIAIDPVIRQHDYVQLFNYWCYTWTSKLLVYSKLGCKALFYEDKWTAGIILS